MIMAGLAAADFVQAAMQNKILAVLYIVAWFTLLRVICLVQRYDDVNALRPQTPQLRPQLLRVAHGTSLQSKGI
jgi:hypothetical protein